MSALDLSLGKLEYPWLLRISMLLLLSLSYPCTSGTAANQSNASTEYLPFEASKYFKGEPDHAHFETALVSVRRSNRSSSRPFEGADAAALQVPQVHVEVSFANMSFVLLLNRRAVFVAQSFTVRVPQSDSDADLDPDNKEAQDDVDPACYYMGSVQEQPVSMASISLCHGVSGVFSVEQCVYVLHANRTGDGGLQHYVHWYAETDTPQVDCFLAQPSFRNFLRNSSRLQRADRQKRSVAEQPSAPNIAYRPSGSTSEFRFIELYLVLDYSFYERHLNRWRTRAYDIINFANWVLRKVDIYLVLVGMEIWSNGNKIVIDGNSTAVLYRFLHYRNTFISPLIPHDNAQLIIGRHTFYLDEYTGTVGKARYSAMCTPDSGGINVDSRESVVSVATTLAHELCHNIGLWHDEIEELSTKKVVPPNSPIGSSSYVCRCEHNGNGCIMTASMADPPQTDWSECSKMEVRRRVTSIAYSPCLSNAPPLMTAGSAWGGSYCGNYLVEGDEQCDCGPLGLCDSHCCDPTSCRLRPGAACATGECCDLLNCSLKPAATLCRPRGASQNEGRQLPADYRDHYECDLPEYCTGASEYCPADLHVLDGSWCRDGMGGASYCYSGSCRTRDSHCRLLWGRVSGDADEYCYTEHNRKGDYYGHCGYDAKTKSYAKCDGWWKSPFCGQAQCHATNDLVPIILGKVSEKLSGLAYNSPNNFIVTRFDNPMHDRNNVLHTCRIAVMQATDSRGRVVDFGMLPDGTKCDYGRVCVAQRCVPVGIEAADECERRCVRGGRCNNLGRCHCDQPFYPRDCR